MMVLLLPSCTTLFFVTLVHVHIEGLVDNLYLFISQFLISVHNFYVTMQTVSEDDLTMSTTHRERIEMSLREDMIIISYKCKKIVLQTNHLNHSERKKCERLLLTQKTVTTLRYCRLCVDAFTTRSVPPGCSCKCWRNVSRTNNEVTEVLSV